MKYGRWTLGEYVRKDKSNNKYYLCECDCGTEKVVRIDHLRSGKSKSCGCIKNEQIKALRSTHNLSGTRIYNIWRNMVRRCNDNSAISFKYYGARGISVCEEWLLDVKTFYDWAINNGYQENLTIERVNNDGNYEPSNCKWITHVEQQLNKRNVLVVK